MTKFDKWLDRRINNNEDTCNCSECNGTGKIEEQEYKDAPIEYANCTYCKGKGWREKTYEELMEEYYDNFNQW